MGIDELKRELKKTYDICVKSTHQSLAQAQSLSIIIKTAWEQTDSSLTSLLIHCAKTEFNHYIEIQKVNPNPQFESFYNELYPAFKQIVFPEIKPEEYLNLVFCYFKTLFNSQNPVNIISCPSLLKKQISDFLQSPNYYNILAKVIMNTFQLEEEKENTELGSLINPLQKIIVETNKMLNASRDQGSKIKEQGGKIRISTLAKQINQNAIASAYRQLDEIHRKHMYDNKVPGVFNGALGKYQGNDFTLFSHRKIIEIIESATKTETEGEKLLKMIPDDYSEATNYIKHYFFNQPIERFSNKKDLLRNNLMSARKHFIEALIPKFQAVTDQEILHYYTGQEISNYTTDDKDNKSHKGEIGGKRSVFSAFADECINTSEAYYYKVSNLNVSDGKKIISERQFMSLNRALTNLRISPAKLLFLNTITNLYMELRTLETLRETIIGIKLTPNTSSLFSLPLLTSIAGPSSPSLSRASAANLSSSSNSFTQIMSPRALTFLFTNSTSSLHNKIKIEDTDDLALSTPRLSAYFTSAKNIQKLLCELITTSEPTPYPGFIKELNFFYPILCTQIVLLNALQNSYEVPEPTYPNSFNRPQKSTPKSPSGIKLRITM